MEYETPGTNFPSGRLHPATIIVELLRSLRGLIWVIAVALLIRFSRGGQGSWIEIVIAAMGALSALGAVLRYLTVRFGIEQDQFVIESGLVFRQRRTIPLARIQNINLKRDLLHQMFGVSEVGIETASGSGAEAQLSVLGVQDAENLRRRLLAQRLESAGPVQVEAPLEPPPVYTASLKALLLAGATQIRAGTVVGAILAAVFFVGEIVEEDGNFIQRLIRQVSAIHVSPVAAAGGAIIAVALAGWIVSIVGSVLRYHDFRVHEEGKRLRVRFGLFTRHERAFPIQRVQVVRLESPLIQRWLGLCRIVAETAGSVTPTEKEAGGASMLCPLIRRADTGLLLSRVLPGLNSSEIDWKPVSRLTIRRSLARLALLGAILFIPAYLRLTPLILWLIPLWIGCSYLYARARYKAIGYGETTEHLLVRGGVFTRVHSAIPIRKIQSLLISQSPLQRRLQLANVQISTASSTFGGGVTIPDLPEDVARNLQDRWSRRSTETTIPSGMGASAMPAIT